MSPLLRMEGITKVYPGVIANHQVDFEVAEGEIHALLGENGAGKTTLMNILYGMTAPDSGRILWRGQEVRIRSPKDASALGIGMVHQHFMLVPRFTAVQNVVLGAAGERGLWLNQKTAARRLRTLSEQYELDIDFGTEVQDLPLGMQQRIEILKALYRGAHLLIMDEPTAVLTPEEVESLFRILRRLAEQGHAAIFISHKLEEVLAISDRVTVLRDGRHVATLETRKTDHAQLAQLMVGRPVVLRVEKTPPRPDGKKVLEVEDLWVERAFGRDQLQGVSLSVREGQILGLAGIDGNGQQTLLEVLCGLTRPRRGRVKAKGLDITGYSPRQLGRLKIGRIPEDRRAMGLLMPLSVWENLALESYFREPFGRWGILHLRHMVDFAQRLVAEFDIRTPSVQVKVSSLSGGNQQKLLLARELHHAPDILIVANATRGLDVGATEYTYQRLLECREKGAGILLISSDLEEILYLSDRIAVIHGGKIMGELPAEQADLSTLGLMMTGVPLGQEP